MGELPFCLVWKLPWWLRRPPLLLLSILLLVPSHSALRPRATPPHSRRRLGTPLQLHPRRHRRRRRHLLLAVVVLHTPPARPPAMLLEPNPPPPLGVNRKRNISLRLRWSSQASPLLSLMTRPKKRSRRLLQRASP